MTLGALLRRHSACGLAAEVARVNAALAHYGSAAAYIDKREPVVRPRRLAALWRRGEARKVRAVETTDGAEAAARIHWGERAAVSHRSVS